MTAIKERNIDTLLLDLPVQLPTDNRRSVFAQNDERATSVTNVHNDHSVTNRTFNFTFTIGSNNSYGEGKGGGMLGTLIGIGVIVWLLWQASSSLGSFNTFGRVFGL